VPVLLDVNVLLALVADRHAHHVIAKHWIHDMAAGDAVICRIVQISLLRLLNNPAVMQEEVLDTTACWEVWQGVLEDERFSFTVSEPPDLELSFRRFCHGQRFSPKLWTDAYLAAFAHAAGLTLVTFDRGFAIFPGLALSLLTPDRLPH